MSENYRLIPRTPDMPEGPGFCLIIESDLMEPLIPKGGRVFVSRLETPGEMELGVFLYRGQVYCRQVCDDYAGNLHLLCANPGRESFNLCLDKREREKCLCLGRVVLDEKPPMPVYV